MATTTSPTKKTCVTCGSDIGVLRGSAGFQRLCARCLLAGAVGGWPGLDEAGGTGSPPEPAGSLTGRTLGNYDILGLLGSGAMGTVYRARQRGLDRLVALKVLSIPGGTDAVERFLREARALARLRHPNIVGVYEVASDGGHHFYTMDLVEGETLDAEVRRRGPPGTARTARLLAAISRAVHHAHERGIVHRDLKPANILLAADGTPMVADFGLARDMSEAVRMTRNDVTLGTAPYMAPEQAAGRRDEVDARTDVYALGAILYECLTGVAPFRGDSVYEVLRRVQEDALVPPRERRPEADPGLEAICFRAMAKKPADRFPSAHALAVAVEQALDGGAPAPALSPGLSPAGAAVSPPRADRPRSPAGVRRALAFAVFLVATGALLALERPWEWRRSVDRAAGEVPIAVAPAPPPGPAPAPPVPPAPVPEPAVPAAVPSAEPTRLDPGVGGIYAIAYNPAGTRYAIAGLTGTIRVFDARNDVSVATLHGHPNAVYCLAWSPDGRTLASGGWEKALKLWDVDREEERRSLGDPSSGIWSLAFSPDGKLLLAGSHDGGIRVWDVARGERLRTIKTEYRLVQALDVSPDGRYVVAAGPGNPDVGLWELASGTWKGMARGDTGAVTSVRYSPDGRLLAAAAETGEVRVFETEAFQEVAVLRGHQASASRVAFRPDGLALASSGEDGAISMWDLTNLARPHMGWLRGHDKAIRALAFRPDGRELASGGDDGTLLAWPIAEGTAMLNQAGPGTQARVDPVVPLGGWRISVAFQDDVDEALLRRWSARVEAASALLFRLTEGQFHIGHCSIEDRTSRGRILIPSGQTRAEVLPGGDAMARSMTPGSSPAWRIESIGDPDGRPGMRWELGSVLVHEILHGVMGFPDERDVPPDHTGFECDACIMGVDPKKLCGPGTHKGKVARSCKEVLASIYPGQVRFPNPGYRPNAAPPKPRITIVNRGPNDLSPELAPFTKEEEKLVKALEQKGRALSIRVGFQGDASPAHLRRMMGYMTAIDEVLRHLSDEQVFIARCTIEDRAKAGLILVEEGAEDRSVLASDPDSMWGRRSTGWVTCGVFPAEALARYVLPELLKVSEADDGCGTCFLNTKVWDGRTRFALCDARSHVGEGRSCRERFLEIWKAAGATEAEKRKDFRSPPAMRFTIVDH